MSSNQKDALYAVLAAALYAVNVPVSKVLLRHVDTAMMAALLYPGAGLGLLLYGALEKALGFVSYGLSINFYILAQKDLGAARTSVYYSIAPFLGAAFGILLLGERPTLQFWAALAIMALGMVLMAADQPQAQ